MISPEVACLMKTYWFQKYGEIWRQDRRERKVLPDASGRIKWEVLFSPALQAWYASPRGQKRYEQPRCFFCDRHDEFLELRMVAQVGHLGVFENLKFCEPQHYLIAPGEHREHCTAEDVLVLRDLCAATGWSIIGNFRNAGASYPQHVHYQSLETALPAVAGEPIQQRMFDGMRVQALRHPELLVRFECAPSARHRAACLVTQAPRPFNVLFWQGNDYLLPRVKSVPSNTCGNKFAAAEVFGRVYCRSRSFYDFLDAGVISAAADEVCLPSGSQPAQEYWEAIGRLAREML